MWCAGSFVVVVVGAVGRSGNFDVVVVVDRILGVGQIGVVQRVGKAKENILQEIFYFRNVKNANLKNL